MCKWLEDRQNWAPTVLRIALAWVFIYHGWVKFADIAGTAGFFGSLGIPAATLFAWVVATVEFVGGLAILVGLFTRYAAGLIALTMVVAFVTMHTPGTWYADGAMTAMFERALLSLGAALSLMFSGAGAFSGDEKWCPSKKKKK